jgi:hypothetical protein
MPPRSWWQRAVERLLPWYDPKVEAARAEHSHVIHEQAIAARIKAEGTIARVQAGGLRGDYARMDKRLKGR